VGRQVLDPRAGQDDAPAGDGHQPGDGLQGGGLAGAVGADQAGDRACGQVEVQVGEDFSGAEADPQAGDL
jgi:hypothetical protein